MKGRSKKSPNRQMLVSGVGSPMVEGQEIDKSNWPLYVTLMPWFLNADEAKLTKGITGLLLRQRPIVARVVGEEMFGEKQDTPVLTLDADANQRLKILHAGLLKAAFICGEIEDLTYVSYRYRPYVTTGSCEPRTVPSSFVIDHVAVVNDRPDSSRFVSKMYEING